MKVRVDGDACVGDGSCAETCPEIFVMEGDLAVVKTEKVPEDLEDAVREASDACPVEAILIDE
ncbi:MAG TPA: ferredoxin [Syntrophorhabdaceae bacterium]|jgi:ferredoxin